MAADYLQNLRYKLQKRIRRLNATDWNHFLYALRQFWVYFDSDPLFVSIVSGLIARYPDYSDSARKMVNGLELVGENEEEAAAIAYGVLKLYSQQDQPCAICVPRDDFDKMLDQFRSLYLEPFYEYIDEHLDDPRFVLATLIRFKHGCEWFWRDDLYGLWNADTQRGEKRLALKLYEYLHSQGIVFTIEPKSASGEADLVSSQNSNEPLIADAKIFNPERGKSAPYILKGFRQIYQYTSDFNESIGYLIIFNTSDKQLRFVLGAGTDPLPKVVVNNKNIFFLVIDLYPHETSASKRPDPEIVEITEQQIVGLAVSPTDTPTSA
jgi:hypothetical protein